MTRTPDAKGDLLVLTEASPNRAHKLLAFAVAPALLVMVFVVSRPYSNVQLHQVVPFVPFYVSAIFLNNLITGVLLFAQFSVLRARALLVIANGYMFAALMIIPYSLAFPGLFEPGQSLLGGLQTTPWLYLLRHCGFAASVFSFALLKGMDAGDSIQQLDARRSIAMSLAVTIAIVIAAAFVCAIYDARLPVLVSDSLRFSLNWIYYAGIPISSLYILALILLWFQRHTVLGLSLMVVSCVHLTGVPLSFYPTPTRFSVGWYVVIILNFIANSVVLVVLLSEIFRLYGRVLYAVRAQQAEREARLITGDAVSAMIAHEIKQPLAAMITRAETSIRRLEQETPDLEKTRDAIKQIAVDGHRAGAIIESIRANFKKDARVRTSFDINALIIETIDLVRSNQQQDRISVSFEAADGLPKLAADRNQLQQVMLNLITNAIDAMADVNGERILSLKTEIHDNTKIVVSVADNGKGITPSESEQVFNPLFTTKSGGMGMGLSICRSIIEAHDGHIWVAPNNPHGAVFSFAISPG